MAGRNVIQLQDVSVEFDNEGLQIQAVKDVSLEIKKGDIYGIIGYSGAGKSTLVRTINLLQRPTAGSVIVNDQDMLALNPKELRTSRKNIGMIFQHFNLMKSLTVFENVDFPLEDSDLSQAERKERVEHLLDLVGLSDRADNYPSQLSGGQKQRVGIARALANNPDILISDEATSALDPRMTAEILSLLSKVNKELGITIVVITHEMDAIKQICNKVAVMENGHLIEKGSVLNIFGKPKQKLTKDFVDTATRVKPALAEIRSSGIAEQLTGQLVQLKFVGDVTKEPIVVGLYKKFGVSARILFSDIEQLTGTTVGVMILALAGPVKKIDQAIQYLQDQKIEIKRIDSVESEEQDV